MNGKILDTNIIIRYIKNIDGLDDIFEEDNLYFSSVTLGELLLGQNVPAKKRKTLQFIRISVKSLMR